MNDDTRRVDTQRIKELAKLRVVLEVPTNADIHVRKDVPYTEHDGEALGMDVYATSNNGAARPAVIFIAGYSDAGAMQLLGFRLKDMGSYVSWAELAATTGLVGITYSSLEPQRDALAAVRFVREHAQTLGVDPERIGIMAFSGNGPTALSLTMDADLRLRFAVLSNTYMLDLDGDTTVAEMSARFGFAAPNTGKGIAAIDARIPLFVVRSGRDEIPGLNASLDRFVSHALASNRALHIVNLPAAPHSFDTLHDTAASRDVIERILSFMRSSSSA